MLNNWRRDAEQSFVCNRIPFFLLRSLPHSRLPLPRLGEVLLRAGELVVRKPLIPFSTHIPRAIQNPHEEHHQELPRPLRSVVARDNGMRHLWHPASLQLPLPDILAAHVLDAPLSAANLLPQRHQLVNARPAPRDPACRRPHPLVLERAREDLRVIRNRCEDDGLVSVIQHDSTPVLEVDEERPRDELGAQRVRVCEVIQKDAGLEATVLEILALGGAVQLGEVVRDEVLVGVGWHAGFVLDAPFCRREAAHPCCFTRVDEVSLDGIVCV